MADLKCNPGNYACGGACIPNSKRCKIQLGANNEASQRTTQLGEAIGIASAEGSVKPRASAQQRLSSASPQARERLARMRKRRQAQRRATQLANLKAEAEKARASGSGSRALRSFIDVYDWLVNLS